MSTPGDSNRSRQPSDVAAALSRIPFRHPDATRQLLSRLLTVLPADLASTLPALFGDAPDPDTALLLFDRLVGESTGEVLRLLTRHAFLAHYSIVVFGHSRYLGEALIQNPDLLASFLREKNLDRSCSREEFHESLARFRSRSFETDASVLLARFKRREYIRIMLRDVLKIAPLAETTAEISALSDVLIADALREAGTRLEGRYGPPQHENAEGRLIRTPFAVLSLGKLGGNELNYSSDVDLLYLYGDGAEAASSTISHREYFVRLSQQLTDILSRVTREGQVFRIDLRLRPQGHEGELALSLGHALRYYAETAHDWERQALIKVRYSAGDERLAREFIRGVQPYVYTTGVNFAAIQTALQARERMHTRRRGRKKLRSEAALDIKVDRGGIRDIEFLVQCLQRVYGGAEPWLRSGGTLFSLQKLHDKAHLSGKEFHDLTASYEFLRHLEHRLQLRMGQQTHSLPADSADLDILRRALARLVPGDVRAGFMIEAVQRRMATVAEIYHRVVMQQQVREAETMPPPGLQLQGRSAESPVDQSNQQILERLAADAPALHEIARQRDLSHPCRRNLFRFLSSAFTSSDRYAAVAQHPEALKRALVIFGASEYLTEILIRHPEEITALTQLGQAPPVGSGPLFAAGATGGSAPADPVLAYAAAADLSHGEKLALLRSRFRHRVFLSGARDIVELRPAEESFAATTAAAENAITGALAIAGQPEGLAIMALGRLGSGEFDLLSDADLLFVGEDGRNRADLTSAAESVMQALAAYTREGTVFPVDTRLRPRGGEGELLITPNQLAGYFSSEAQPWEALMYTKLRYIAGSAAAARQASSAAAGLFQRYAADPGFLQPVLEMRARLQDADAGEKNLKSSPGGAYDIDFMTSYLSIKHNLDEKGGSLQERIRRCHAAGLLGHEDTVALERAANLLRTVEHLVRLALGRARKWLPATEHARRVTEEFAAKMLGHGFREGLEAELEQARRGVREIYWRVLAPRGC